MLHCFFHLCPEKTLLVMRSKDSLTAAVRQCYKEDGSSKNPDCPVCSKSLNKLAQPLPMAHCANSRLVCKISGEVMNENNPPMMLPNGYVYGYNVSNHDRPWLYALSYVLLVGQCIMLLICPSRANITHSMVNETFNKM